MEADLVQEAALDHRTGPQEIASIATWENRIGLVGSPQGVSKSRAGELGSSLVWTIKSATYGSTM